MRSLIGIEFKRNNEYNNFLSLIFDGIDLSKYNFIFPEKDMFQIEDFDDELGGEKFSEIITKYQVLYCVSYSSGIFER